jgi:diguanylate cyclase (GGDEF)-like protein/PAS domain S-box-containing protein
MYLIEHQYDFGLVGLSYAVAAMAAYTALELARRVTRTRLASAKYLWLSAGALSMGSGIWSMHFIGMLAYHVDIPVTYDVPITLLSWLVAVLVSGFALYIGSSDNGSRVRLLTSGAIMGLGICAMHYTGMAAMQIQAELNYDPKLFALSLIIAITASTLALWLFHWFSAGKQGAPFFAKACTALVMGLAVCGMHYTGMEAAYYFVELDALSAVSVAPDIHWLAISLASVTLVILGVTLLVIFYDHKLSAHAEIGQRLQGVVKSRTAELLMVKERAEVTLDHIADGVITTDALGRVEHINPVAQALTGWSKEAAKGLALNEVFHVVNERTRGLAGNLAAAVQRDGRPLSVTGHTILVARDGREYAIDESASPIFDANKNVCGTVIVFRDVTTGREQTRRISRQASHDPLTGLMNRHEFETRLQQALASAVSQSHEHCLIHFNLDRLKLVNDTGGYAAGDEVMRQVTRVIAKAVRESDAFARLGGDEFGILLEKCPLSGAKEIAEKLRKLVEDFSIYWEGRIYKATLSIGLVAVTARSGGLTQVLTSAHDTCFIAKQKGRNNVHVCLNCGDGISNGNTETLWVERIRQALAENRFVFFHQRIEAISATADATSKHFEILLRLRDEQGRLLPPGSFIPVAERYGLMPTIDRWVVSNALRLLQGDRQLASTLSTCAINLSGQSLSEDSFLAFVEQQFDITGVNPKLICFEITETAAIGNLDKAVKLIQVLRKRGCSFSLDDFGSGLSSFAYLKNLMVDYLKIDGFFIKNMEHNETDAAIVRAICDIGHALGIKTVAEFVEDRSIVDRLKGLGVDYIQGYGVEHPSFLSEYVPPACAEELVAKRISA